MPDPVIGTTSGLVERSMPLPDGTETGRRVENTGPGNSFDTEARILGRVIDEFDAPLAGVEVHLSAFGPWSDDPGLPQIESIDGTRGWLLRTDASGAFCFHVPTPTAKMQLLWIEPDSFHERIARRFGIRGEDPTLTSGDCDLGEFQLRTMGVVEGIVRDTEGQPLDGVLVNLADDDSSSIPMAWSNSEGKYRIDHAPPGRVPVSASLEGYLQTSSESIEVLPEEVTGSVKLTLSRAPSIRGMVIDQSGVPIEGAHVCGLPDQPGESVSCTSHADGTFCLFLTQEQPHRLDWRFAGFELVPFSDPTLRFAPGTTTARLAMRRLPTRQFIVVDARSEEPIESFGIAISGPASGYAGGRFKRRVHLGGRIEIGLDAKFDSVLVQADGYRDGRVLPKEFAGDGLPTIVALELTPAIVGHLVYERAALPGTVVNLMVGDWTDEEDSSRVFQSDGDALRVRSDREGQFRFSEIPGNHPLARISATGPHGSVLETAPFEIGEGVTDLGSVTLVSGAVITGRVLPPPGRPLAGLGVILDSGDEDRSAVTDAEGRFRFDAVRSGLHKLELRPRLGLIESPPPQMIQLLPSQSTEVIIDAREWGTCPVTVTVLIDSVPAANEWVRFRFSRDGAGDDVHAPLLGRTDSQGRVEGYLPARGLAFVTVEDEGVGRITWPESVDCRLDVPLELELKLDLGSLEVLLPKGIAEVDIFRLSCQLQQQQSGAAVAFHGAVTSTGSMPRSLHYERVFAGSYLAHVKLVDITNQRAEADEPARDSKSSPSVLSDFEIAVTIRPGQKTVIQIP